LLPVKSKGGPVDESKLLNNPNHYTKGNKDMNLRRFKQGVHLFSLSMVLFAIVCLISIYSRQAFQFPASQFACKYLLREVRLL
jgi:hypothetical protein